MLKKLTLVFISVLLVVGCMAVPAMAEDAVTYTFNRTHYIAAESSMGGYGEMFTENEYPSNLALKYVTLDISAVPQGNYEVVFNGKAASETEGSSIFVSLEASGNEKIYNFIPCKGTDIYTASNTTPTSLGVVSLNSDAVKKMKFSLIRGGNTMGWTFTLTRVGDYDPKGTYRFEKIFNNDPTFLEKSTSDNYGVYQNNWMSWTADVAYSGIYDVYFYGGVQSEDASMPGMAFALSMDGTDILSATAPWTGSYGTNYLGKTGSNIGWGTHKYTKVGSVALGNGTQTLKFINKSSVAHTSQMSDSYSRLIFVRTGDIVPLGAPEITTTLDNENLSNSKVIIDFDKEIDSTASNLAYITTTGAYGTATVALDSTDASKVIVTGVAGRFTVNVSAGFKATDGTMLSDACSSECYIPSCKVTQYAAFNYNGKYYAQATAIPTQGQPSIQIWLALYNDKEELIAVGGSSSNVIGTKTGTQFSLNTGLMHEEYAGKYTTAKLFVWEKDMTPLMIAYDTKGAIN